MVWIILTLGIVALFIWIFGCIFDNDSMQIFGGIFSVLLLLSSMGSCIGKTSDWNNYGSMQALKTNIGVYTTSNNIIGEYEYHVPSGVITDLAQNNTGIKRAENVITLQNHIINHNDNVANWIMLRDNWPLRFKLYSAKLPQDYGYIIIDNMPAEENVDEKFINNERN
ncbi:hypothetical protein M0R19_05870 [Candidatus Pacearchaeota archaeon]|jgi:hypothetical protein|nr:hypothetical protein [Candidatus Pacearchaeota archaeon]